MKGLATWLVWSLVLVITAVAGISATMRLVAAANGPIQIGSRVAPLEGFTADGTLVNAATLTKARCHLLRFTSDRCQFSLNSRPLINRLEAAALAQGCDSVVLGPSPDTFECPLQEHHPQHVHLVYVAADHVAALGLSRTPSVAVFDRFWRVRWIKIGLLNAADVDGALRQLGTM